MPALRNLCLLFCVIAPVAYAQQDERERVVLPKYETSEEQLLKPLYTPPAVGASIPPSNPVRAMAEFEELEGIVIRWAYGTQNLLLSQITDAAQEEGKVWILVRPSTSDSLNIKTYLASRSIPLTNLEFLPINTNSIWSRDYGPWSVYDVTTDSLGFVDFIYNRPRPLDDVVPGALASLWGLPVYSTTSMPDSLLHTGGNFIVDGFGTGFSSRLIVDENPHQTLAGIDSVLSRYCGLHRFVKMTRTTYDVISHIDMHMKLLDEETLLIGQYPVNRADYAVIEANVNYLRTLSNCYGRPYRIIRIPMPPDAQGRYPDNGSSYLTYTNSIIVNRTVLVPIYSLPTDAGALQIYRDAMPGYNIVGFDCSSIIPLGGAIHCIAKEVGVQEPVFIAHSRLQNTSDTAQAFRVAANIRVRSGVDSAFVLWRTDTTSDFAGIRMTDSSGMFTANIPAQSWGTTVWYYLGVYTASGRVVTKPLVGPDGPYRFEVTDTTTFVSEERYVPVTFTLGQNYPNPFNPATTFAYAIPRQADVEVKLFDMLGREVETLFKGRQEGGTYSIAWNASRYSSGVYFYRLTVLPERGNPGFVETRKAMMLK